MVRVIIHAGLPKTGSSSFQTAMAAGRDALAAAGFFYPPLESPVAAGHALLGALWRAEMPEGFHLRRRLDLVGPPAEVQARVRAEIRGAIKAARDFGPEAAVILSDEHLSFAEAASGCRRLGAILERNGAEAEVLFYLRPDPDLLPSAVQQKLKTQGVTSVGVAQVSHLTQFDHLVAGFGRPALRWRIFRREALAGGDLVTDLCGWIGARLGRPLPDLPATPRVNESMPAPATALLQWLSAGSAPDANDRAFGKVRWAAMQGGVAGPKLALPEGWEARLRARAAQHWNALVAGADHPEAMKPALRMAPAPAAPEITAGEISAWVSAARDPGYEAALLDWIAAQRAPWAGETARWLAARIEAGPARGQVVLPSPLATGSGLG